MESVMAEQGEPANPYFEDADPSQIVIVSLSKKGGCRFLRM
jgi:hypothetical protein